MKPISRISTRGYYDLLTGKTLKNNSYYLYPKKDFKKLIDSKELTIMIHGLRNDNAGAIAKVVLAKNRLRKLGYSYPVIGYSYDSNTTGAHLIKYAKRSLSVGQKIAKKNGKNLGKFIEDFKSENPNIKIRLMGHSLGTQVILSTLEYLAKKKNNYLDSSCTKCSFSVCFENSAKITIATHKCLSTENDLLSYTALVLIRKFTGIVL